MCGWYEASTRMWCEMKAGYHVTLPRNSVTKEDNIHYLAIRCQLAPSEGAGSKHHLTLLPTTRHAIKNKQNMRSVVSLISVTTFASSEDAVKNNSISPYYHHQIHFNKWRHDSDVSSISGTSYTPWEGAERKQCRASSHQAHCHKWRVHTLSCQFEVCCTISMCRTKAAT